MIRALVRCSIPAPFFQKKLFAKPFSTMAANFDAVIQGEEATPEYRVYFEKGGKRVSPFHDIPLFADEAAKTYNMVRFSSFCSFSVSPDL
tara:strand:+ start:316 stop:585 length:270 start_codon:yes stop_codon:yes gene_type:complete